jgi:hypothetical protein
MDTATETYRSELTKMPERIAALPVFRGFPIPWFVAYPNGPEGEPEFRVADARKWKAAVQMRPAPCWVCGQQLGAYLAFVLGPMCGITRTTSEPACHRECAEWSILNCPFLTRPHMVRREDNLPEGVVEPGGNHLTRNAGVSLLWCTRSFSLFRGPDRKYLIQVGDPLEVHCFAEGRRATRHEVDESVAGGLPSLIDLAKVDGPEAEAELVRQVQEFEFYLPAR